MQDTHADLDMNDPERRRWVETSTGLSFPSDTIWDGAHAGFWLEADIYLKFRIRKKELAELFASLPLEWNSTKRFMTNANNSYQQDWFHPDSIEKFQSAKLNRPDEHRDEFRILYDTSTDPEDDESLVTVYLIWSGS